MAVDLNLGRRSDDDVDHDEEDLMGKVSCVFSPAGDCLPKRVGEEHGALEADPVASSRLWRTGGVARSSRKLMPEQMKLGNVDTIMVSTVKGILRDDPMRDHNTLSDHGLSDERGHGALEGPSMTATGRQTVTAIRMQAHHA